MSGISLKIITALFAFSIITTITSLILASLNFILDYSGFNMSTITPTCTGQTYLIRKLAPVYLPLRVHTISAILAALLSIIVLIIMCKMYCALRGEENAQNMHEQKMASKCEISALFLMVSLIVLGLISNAGGNLSLIVDNNSCPVVQSSNLKILVAVSIISFLSGLTQWVLVLALDCMREDDRDQQVINLRDLQGKNDMIREEQAMSKHLDQHAKEYISNNFNKKEDLLQGLIKKQYDVYGESGRPLENPPRLAENPKYQQAAPIPHPFPPPQDQNNQPQEGEKEGQKKNKKNKKGKKGMNKDNEENGNNDKSGKKKNKKGNKVAAKMHAYHAQAGPNDDGQPIPMGGTQFYFGQKESSYDEDSSSQQSIDRDLLYAENEDNLSEKFDEKNFQLDYDLERAMEDEQQDLSPLQLKELMRFTKDSYVLKNNNKQGLFLQRQYQEPNIKINVNFVKIKEHKQEMREEMERLNNAQTTPQNVTANEKEGKKELVEENEKPVTEEIVKLLKVTLFSNSEFYRKEEEKQTECPIQKYVKNEQGFEVVQSHQKTGKNKRVEYSKQQLLFSKKRKDINEEQQREKTSLRQQFNENQSIRMERVLLFGENWANEQDRDTLARGREKLGRSKKRKLVEVIRSKFYE